MIGVTRFGYLLLLASASLEGILAQDLCTILRERWSWNGKELSISGRVTITSEDGPFLEPENCLVNKEVLLELQDGDRPLATRLDRAIASYNPFTEIVVATMVGTFQANRNAQWGHLGGSQVRMLVKDITRLAIVRRTTPIDNRDAENILRVRRGVMWASVRAVFTSLQGKEYFHENLEGKEIPGGVHAIDHFDGWVVGIDESWVTVSLVQGASTGDRRLKSSEPISWKGRLTKGTKVRV